MAAALLFHLLRLWIQNNWIALFAAGTFAWSPLVWRYNVVAEVFSLHTLFVLLLLFWTWRWLEHQRAKDFYSLCLTIALVFLTTTRSFFLLLPLSAFAVDPVAA